MRRLIFLVTAASCVLSSAPATAAGTLTLCYERREVLPWRTLDGQGLNFELLREVSQRVGVQFDYRGMPWKRCLEAIKANAVDGGIAVSFYPARLAVGAYPGGAHPDRAKRMNVGGYMLVRRRGSAIDWDGKAFHHVDGKIGFQLGYSVGEFLRSQGVSTDEGSQQPEELAQKLAAGRLAAAAFGAADAQRLAHGPFSAQLEVLPVPLLQQDYYLMLSHAMLARDPQLANRLWNEVGAVRTSPGYARLEASRVEPEWR